MSEDITIPVAYLKSVQSDLDAERALADRLAEALGLTVEHADPWGDDDILRAPLVEHAERRKT